MKIDQSLLPDQKLQIPRLVLQIESQYELQVDKIVFECYYLDQPQKYPLDQRRSRIVPTDNRYRKAGPMDLKMRLSVSNDMAKLSLTPPTKPIFYISVVFGVWALVLYFVGMIGVVEDTFHFAFWIAIAAWLAMTAGVAAKGV